MSDNREQVDHPDWYNRFRTGEVIELARLLPFSAGCAVKYILRKGKENYEQDLHKAVWYINDVPNGPETNPSPFEADKIRRLAMSFGYDLTAAGLKPAGLALVALCSAVIHREAGNSASTRDWLRMAENLINEQLAELKGEQQ